ncbi:hypothetical protein HPB51_006312 [Rhipicephalus microplus]|uniref:Phospholipid scramblase n=1 Tax=Rhipicephalus microplus TaxID=6941 RepID=A0A9J6EN26_RHIMP|nr:hypothetical protein HPB51_006312 [Rhipicephalus microplus]
MRFGTHMCVSALAVLVPYEQQNKYVVKNTMGQFIFMANEESDLASRCCLGSCRPFEMALLDYRSVEVMRLYRPLRCDSCLCFCCLQVGYHLREHMALHISLYRFRCC